MSLLIANTHSNSTNNTSRPVETAGTLAQSSPSIFTTTTETAGSVASSAPASCASSINAVA